MQSHDDSDKQQDKAPSNPVGQPDNGADHAHEMPSGEGGTRNAETLPDGSGTDAHPSIPHLGEEDGGERFDAG